VSYTDKIKLGMKSEFKAAAWLQDKNYSVFWRTQDNDVIDFVAVHRVTGKTILVDVKTASFRKTWKPGTMIGRNQSKYQKQLGVKILYVFKNGECKWKK
tara:strand:+ start:367 stop:663 length:297 start_codon:yes stop_codon:yes gene_type:complete